MESGSPNFSRLKDLESNNSKTRLFQNSFAKAVSPVLDRHISEKGEIIEIGSGLGYFIGSMPKYKSRLSQTDYEREVIESHKILHPDSNIVMCHYSDAPFRNRSFAYAIGLNSFDNMIDSVPTIEMAYELLTRHGKIIHVRDCSNYPNSISEFDYDKGHMIPFPAFDPENEYPIGIKLVPHSARNSVHKLDTRIRKYVAAYMNNSEKMLNNLISDANGNISMLRTLSIAGSKLHPNAQLINFHNHYREKLISELNAAGFKIIDEGITEGGELVDRGSKQYSGQRFNVYRNDVGILKKQLDKEVGAKIGKNDLLLVSSLEYLVAQKDESFSSYLRGYANEIADKLRIHF